MDILPISFLPESQPLSGDQTLVSPGEKFELGFFNPAASRWYIGIWYKNIPERTYVWVANRDKPLSDSFGSFGISGKDIFIRDRFGELVWSSPVVYSYNDGSPVVAELLENGNLVLRYSNNNNEDDEEFFLWQSFDFPTDTLLPGMKLGSDSTTVHAKRFLTSWKDSYDPSTGDFVFSLETKGFLVLSTRINGAGRFYRSGPWDGAKFIGLPLDFNVTKDSEETTCLFIPTNSLSFFSRLVLNYTGILYYETWNQRTTNWDILWFSLSDQCDIYDRCRFNSYCDLNTCNCLQGFEPRDPNAILNGCTRKTPLTCGANTFSKLARIKFPYTLKPDVYDLNNVKECRKMCVHECNCTAYAVTQSLKVGRSTCVLWRGDLADLRRFSNEGLDIFIKQDGIEKEKSKNGVNIGLVVGIPTIALILILLALYCLWRRNKRITRARARAAAASIGTELQSRTSVWGGMDNHELPRLEFGAVVEATQGFSSSNQVGQGGFGIVFKGRLPNGEEIAVKTLSKSSTQGNQEFMAEVEAISKLQHVNLVKLLGWSVNVENDEKALIYEYLVNGSLDSYIFDDSRRYELDWDKRFDIISGITRGLAYMQEDSRTKIIHRDLKPSNVLLDKDMVPKISDFGLARIVERTEKEVITTATVGTYGYMSPEYGGEGRYSNKSDIFSFGVIVLEIICGKRSRTFTFQGSSTHFLTCVWARWKDGVWEDLVDPVVAESLPFRREEILRCIQVGLLCVQENAEDRPMMSSVVVMLGSETAEIPPPKPPGFFTGRRRDHDHPSTSSNYAETSTVNQITVTDIVAR